MVVPVGRRITGVVVARAPLTASRQMSSSATRICVTGRLHFRGMRPRAWNVTSASGVTDHQVVRPVMDKFASKQYT